MTSLAVTAPAPHIRLLVWLWELRNNQEWRRSSAVSATQWIAKYLLIVAGANYFGHGVFMSGLVTAGWDLSIYPVNRWIWRDRPVRPATSLSRTAVIWLICFGLNLGLVELISGLAGWPISTTKLMLIPEGILMNPLMFWLNDQVIFQRGGLQRLWRAAR